MFFIIINFIKEILDQILVPMNATLYFGCYVALFKSMLPSGVRHGETATTMSH